MRGPQGGGIRLAAQHWQSLEAWFAHVPGLVGVAPSTPYDAKGLLAAAIRDDNPVIFLEHKMLYPTKGEVPEGDYVIPLGKADIKRAGTDVTVVATQVMVQRALQVAGDLEKEGISVEVIDPRTLVPLDEDAILASVAKTNRLVIVHEAVKRGGFGAEIAAMVSEEGLDLVDAPLHDEAAAGHHVSTLENLGHDGPPLVVACLADGRDDDVARLALEVVLHVLDGPEETIADNLGCLAAIVRGQDDVRQRKNRVVRGERLPVGAVKSPRHDLA